MPLAAAAATHPETPPLLPARESSFLLLSGRYGQQVAPVGNLDRGGKVPRALGLQSCPGAPGAECRPLGGLAGVARPFPRETVPPGRPRQLKSQIHLLSTPAYGVSLLCEPVKSSLSALPGLTRSDQPQERRTPSGVRPRALGSRDPQGLPEVLRVAAALRKCSDRPRRDGGVRAKTDGDKSVRWARGGQTFHMQGTERPGRGRCVPASPCGQGRDPGRCGWREEEVGGKRLWREIRSNRRVLIRDVTDPPCCTHQLVTVLTQPRCQGGRRLKTVDAI